MGGVPSFLAPGSDVSWPTWALPTHRCRPDGRTSCPRRRFEKPSNLRTWTVEARRCRSPKRNGRSAARDATVPPLKRALARALAGLRPVRHATLEKPGHARVRPRILAATLLRGGLAGARQSITGRSLSTFSRCSWAGNGVSGGLAWCCIAPEYSRRALFTRSSCGARAHAGCTRATSDVDTGRAHGERGYSCFGIRLH